MLIQTNKRDVCILAALLLGLLEPASAQVTVEIVNDSGKPDGSVFLKVPGKLWPGYTGTPVIPTDLFVNIADTNVSAAVATSVPLSTLETNHSAAPYDAVSTISGRTNRVYSFQADYLNLKDAPKAYRI